MARSDFVPVVAQRLQGFRPRRFSGALLAGHSLREVGARANVHGEIAMDG